MVFMSKGPAQSSPVLVDGLSGASAAIICSSDRLRSKVPILQLRRTLRNKFFTLGIQYSMRITCNINWLPSCTIIAWKNSTSNRKRMAELWAYARNTIKLTILLIAIPPCHPVLDWAIRRRCSDRVGVCPVETYTYSSVTKLNSALESVTLS